jgi:hypothetical protein
VIRFDPGRQRLWARPDQVATLLLSVDEPNAPMLSDEAAKATLADFAEAGVTAGGSPVREVAELLAVLVHPQLLVEVETSIGDDPGPGHTLWLGQDLGVLAEGMPGEPRYVYAPVAPTLVPWVLGHLVALRRRPTPAFGHAVTVARRLLDGAMGDLHAGDAARATRSLTAEGGLDDDSAAAIVRMLDGRRLTWRATTAWLDGSPQSRSLTVVDAVDAGYWVSSVPEGADLDDPAVGVSLEPVSSGEAWRRLTGLLPGVGSAPP